MIAVFFSSSMPHSLLFASKLCQVEHELPSVPVAKRDYGQYCGLARALELVGERWALLIVRDLLVGPRRYTDLRRGLPRIPTNILSARLKELEAGGVVRRRLRPRPDSAVVYELTEFGAELEEAVLHLGRWGARAMSAPRPGEIVTADSLTTALKTTFVPEAARRVDAVYALRVGPVALRVHLRKGTLDVGEGPAEDAAATIEASPAIRAIMAGEVSPAAAIAAGDVTLSGDPALAPAFFAAFRIGPPPAAVTSAEA
jgi:DNA-binding HxlR family transcriptional regulator